MTRPASEEFDDHRAEQQAWVAELRRVGLLGQDTDATAGDIGDDELILSLHRYLARTPSRLLALALTDAVGERRTQNQPGTTDEYPNWRVPLAGPDGRPMLLEDVFTDTRAAALAEVMRVATHPVG